MTQQIEKTRAMSVGAILREASGSVSHWRLALVQRDRVWTPYKAAKLLDSLLNGYPIGSLLLCKADNSHVLAVDGAYRTAQRARGWQLLDGQQRLWALTNLFGWRASTGTEPDELEFFLKPDADRPDLDPGKRHDPALRRWITWSDVPPCPFEAGGDYAGQRNKWLSVACVGRALIRDKDGTRGLLTADAKTLARWLRVAEPKYRGPSPAQSKKVERRLRSLCRAMSTAFIPVQRVVLDGPEQVLEVFTRSNMEGVKTSQADIFFAAIKTQWPDAEECLDRLRGESGLLNRMDTLRFTARLAASRIGRGDPIPLMVKRLSGDKRGRLRVAMANLARDAEAANRVQSTVKLLSDVLGHAWWYVDRYLVDDVLAWAVAARTAVADSEVRVAAGYLFWGTALRIRTVLRNPYAHRSFRAFAGSRDAVCPVTAAVRAGVEGKLPHLAHGRASMPRPFDPNDRGWGRRNVVNSAGRLFLSLGQQLSVTPERRLDWDHIFPRGLRLKLKWYGSGGELGRKVFHDGAGALWRAGNLCALDASLNRGLHHLPPGEKLKRLRVKGDQGTLYPDSLFINEADEAAYGRIDRALSSFDGHAPRELAEVVRRREGRLWNDAVRRLPVIHRLRQVLYPDNHD